MIIVAIDPGPHTGVATRLNNGLIYSQMLHNKVFDIWKYLIKVKPNVIIVEQFNTNGRLTNDMLRTIEIQGSIYSIAWMLQAELIIQHPGDRTPFIPEAREKMGLNHSKIQSHEVDAVAHILRYLKFNEERLLPLLQGGARGTTAQLYVPPSALTETREFKIIDSNDPDHEYFDPEAYDGSGSATEKNLGVAEAGMALPAEEVHGDGRSGAGPDA